MSANSENTKAEYLNLHTTACGYVNGLRLVKPKPGAVQQFTPFWSVRFVALFGPKDSPSRVHYNVKAVGETSELVEKYLEPALAKNQNVFAYVRIGDAKPEIYTINSGERQGEQAVSMKGRLIHVSGIYIGDEEVYREPWPETHPAAAVEMEQVDTAESARPVDEKPEVQPQSDKPAVAETKVDGELYFPDLPERIKLDREKDPEFQAKLAEIKATKKYRWDGETTSWVLKDQTFRKSEDDETQIAA